MTADNSIDMLSEKYNQFKILPFPESPDTNNDELLDIFSDLVELDGHIAGLISSFLSHKYIGRKLVYIDKELNNRISSYKPKTSKEINLIEQYKNYKSHLDELVLYLKELIDMDL